MKKQELKYFRALLAEKINELLNEAGKTVTDLTDGRENTADMNDRATIESEVNLELRIRDRERRLIFKMREAIQRIDEGTFGICDECGEPISVQRLMARPVTTFCIECKKQEEKIQRTKGGNYIPSMSFAE
jgi:DnaK suppressor protein